MSLENLRKKIDETDTKIIKLIGERTRIAKEIGKKKEKQGIQIEDIGSFVEEIEAAEGVVLEGLSTHFANIEDTTDHSYAKSQLQQFKRMASRLKQLGINPLSRHTACSAALLLFKDTYFDLVRPGIAVYGYWPSKETYVSYSIINI